MNNACARFDIAKELNMPHDHPVLKGILQELQCDEEWDQENPLELIYKKQGLKRYKLEGLNRFKTKSVTDKVTEGVASTSTSSGASSVGPLFASAGSSSKEPTIKLENPEWAGLQQQLSVVKSAKAMLEKLLSQALDVKVSLQQKAAHDAVYEVKLKDYSSKVDLLTSFVQEVREFMFLTEGLNPSDDIKATMEKALTMADLSTGHADGIKSLMKRVRAMF